MKYWLMKTEPSVYSIDVLEREKITPWEGIRNYQARNYMMNDMAIGDGILIYHSNAAVIGVVGIAKVCKLAYPDDTAMDNTSAYFDPKSRIEKPTWYRVDVEFVQKFSGCITLSFLKGNSDFSTMKVIQKGQRLSIQPVEKYHFEKIKKIGECIHERN